MHPRIKEIVDNSFFLRSTIEEVGSLLPEDDGELDLWIAQAVAAKDSTLFLYLVVAALFVERGYSSRHLGRGLHLLRDRHFLTTITLRASGDDVPEQILEALRHTAISPLNQSVLLFTAAEWCKEHREGKFPPELLTEARLMARKPLDLQAETHAFLTCLAQTIGDQRILDLLVPPPVDPASREKVDKACGIIGTTHLGLCHRPIANFLHEEASRTLSGYTVRRSVGHTGRNDACPCGSGKKYKRCCHDKDLERLQHSTDIAGKTQAEITAEPEQHLDIARLKKAQPTELCHLDPLKLEPDLVTIYCQRLCAYKLWEEFTTAIESLGWTEELDDAWFFALYKTAGEGRNNLVERLLAARRAVEDPPFDEPPPDCVRLLLVRDDPAEFLKVLDQISTESAAATNVICPQETALALLYSPYPALGILLARGVIPITPKRHAVNLLDEILIARERLNFPPDEPFSDVLDQRFASEAVAHGARETEQLRQARLSLLDKAGEVRQMKSNIEQLRAEIERREKQAAERDAKPNPAPAPTVDVEILRGLRQKVATLKSTLKDRHEERAVLRRELTTTLTEVETLRENQPQTTGTHTTTHDDHEDHLVLPDAIEGSQPFRLIAFPKKFHHTLGGLPRQVARGALTLLGRLAAGEPDAFHGIVRLKQRPDTLRARIGIDHRLLFHLEADTIQVVDLIPRQDLERRIKTL